jgi:hypothetical protein
VTDCTWGRGKSEDRFWDTLMLSQRNENQAAEQPEKLKSGRKIVYYPGRQEKKVFKGEGLID